MTVKIASWNVRGLNDPSKHKEIKKLVLNENINVMGVLETKIKQVNEINICAKCFGNWSFLSNSQPTVTGRVWVCWDTVICNVQMISMSNQHIFCKITELATNDEFFATFVYAENKHILRVPLFENLAQISWLKSNSPSIFLGILMLLDIVRKKLGKSGGIF